MLLTKCCLSYHTQQKVICSNLSAWENLNIRDCRVLTVSCVFTMLYSKSWCHPGYISVFTYSRVSPPLSPALRALRVDNSPASALIPIGTRGADWGKDRIVTLGYSTGLWNYSGCRSSGVKQTKPSATTGMTKTDRDRRKGKESPSQYGG